MSTLRHRLCERIASGALRMRARGVFTEMSGVNSKKNAVGAIWAQLYAILDDGSQTICDLSCRFFILPPKRRKSMAKEKTLTGNMHVALALGCAVAMAISSFAAERTWIGESGGSWYSLPIHICSGAVIRCKVSYRLKIALCSLGELRRCAPGITPDSGAPCPNFGVLLRDEGICYN